VLDFVLLQIGLVTLYADRSEALGVIDLVSFVLFSRRAHLGPASGPRT
jgi:hypothetical protein